MDLRTETKDRPSLRNSRFSFKSLGHAKRIKVPDTHDTVEEEQLPSVAKVWENKDRNQDVNPNQPMGGPSSSQPSETIAPILHINKGLHVLNGKTFFRESVIGRGGSSKVYKVKDINEKTYALKKVSFENVDANTVESYINETKLLKQLQGHDTIIQMYDYEVNREKGYLLMLMECGDIDLANVLCKQQGKPPDMTIIREYWRQMLQAVQTIHEKAIVHSDLKPANFLLVAGSLKLIDFGIAKAIPNDTTNIYRDAQMGTINYMSPEAIMDTNVFCASGQKLFKVGRPSDVWSLGCILYQMIYGHTPFSHLNVAKAIQYIPDVNYAISFPRRVPIANKYKSQTSMTNLVDSLVYTVEEDAIRIMKSCLQRDSKKRMTIPELLSDSFIQARQEDTALEKVLPCIVREVLKYSSCTPSASDRVDHISKAILSQLRQKKPLDSSQWD